MPISTPQKWLIGCGIGCAAMVVLVVGLLTSAVFFFRSRFQPLQEASDSRREIIATHGAPEAFVPPSNGAISPERMEIFLAVRSAIRDDQARLDKALAGFDFDVTNQKRPSIGNVLRTLSDMSRIVIPIGEYVKRRNQVLMEKGMGLGEYAYIYSIAYHSWLGHLPDEGPPLFDRARQPDRGGGSFSDSPFGPESVRAQYHRLALRLLKNQLNGIRGPGQTKWSDTLKAEIDRMERDPDRVAWEDDLPPLIKDSLEPHRGPLEASYNAAANYFELLTLEDISRLQYTVPQAGRDNSRNRPYNGPVEATGPGGAATGGASGDVTYEVAAGVTAPVPLEQPSPPYTDEARKAGIEGVVSLQVLILKDGRVGSLKVTRGLGHGLDQSALETIQTRWIFKPAMLQGAPVDVQARIDVRFRLH